MCNFTWAEKRVYSFDLLAIEKPRILAKANSYLLEKPRTVTADLCERSRGDAHDFILKGITGGLIQRIRTGRIFAGMGKLILPILSLTGNL